MVLEDRIDMLRIAQRLIWEAVENIEAAVHGTSNEAHTRAYLIDHLRAHAESWNPYDTSCETLIEQMQADDEERMDHGWFRDEDEEAEYNKRWED